MLYLRQARRYTTLCLKTVYRLIVNNFGKYGLIFKILLRIDS